MQGFSSVECAPYVEIMLDYPKMILTLYVDAAIRANRVSGATKQIMKSAKLQHMARFARFAHRILMSQDPVVCVVSLQFGCLGSIGLGLMFKFVRNVEDKIMLPAKHAVAIAY